MRILLCIFLAGLGCVNAMATAAVVNGTSGIVAANGEGFQAANGQTAVNTQIGVLFTDDFARADGAVGNSWTEDGSGAGATIVSSKMHFALGASSLTKFIRQPYLTSSENFTIRWRFTVPAITATSVGPAVGTLMRNSELALPTQRSYLGQVECDSSADKGRLWIYRNNGSGTFTSIQPGNTKISPLPAAGDVIEGTISLVGWTVTVTGQNITQGGSVASTSVTLITGASGNVIPGPRDIVVYPVNGTSDVSLIEYKNKEYTSPHWLVIGYSITQGANASTYANSWVRELATLRPSQRILNYAGGSAKTANMVTSIDEIKAYRARRVLMGGLIGNDILVGTASGTYQANYASIVSSVESVGADVYHIVDTPRDATDMTPAKTWLEATYSGKTVDCFTPLATGTALNNTYDSTDGVHPNDAGHDLVATTAHAVIP